MDLSRIIPILALLALGAATLPAQDFTRRGGDYETTFEKRFDMAPGGALEVRLSAGDLRIVAADGNAVTVRHRMRLDAYTEAEARKARDAAEAGYRRDGNHLVIDQEGAPGWIEQYLEIRLPASFDVATRLGQGDIAIDGVSGRLDLTTGQGDIDLLNGGGVVELRSGAGDLTIRNLAGQVDGNTAAGDIDVSGGGESLRLRTSGGDVRIEKANSVYVATAGGRIVVRDIDGEVEARTSGGDIRAEQCRGAAELRTSGGDIELAGMSDRVEARTSGGDIRGADMVGSVVVQTSGGDIDLREVSGEVNAQTSAGRIRLRLAASDPSRPHRVSLETASGDIELWIPESLPATIEAEVHGAGGGWSHFDIHSDFPLTRTVSGGGDIIRKTGDINGGGDRIVLECYHGDIYIRKR